MVHQKNPNDLEWYRSIPDHRKKTTAEKAVVKAARNSRKLAYMQEKRNAARSAAAPAPAPVPAPAPAPGPPPAPSRRRRRNELERLLNL